MEILNLLEKRDQVRYFSEKKPDEMLIKKILRQTFKLTPSKQNLFSYNIFVLKDNDLGHLQSKKHHDKKQIFYNAPYTLLFCNRHVKNPNSYVKHLMKERGHRYKKCDENFYKDHQVLHETCIEIGMFAKILTILCIDNKIDVGYNLCIEKQQHGFDFINDRILFCMHLGYKKFEYDKEFKKKFYNDRGETKPDVNEIIIWK